MTMQAASDHTTPSAVLDRVSLVLDAFDGAGRLTLAQIVRRTGLPRSSAHRMLERLVTMRWLHREGRDYTLGLRLMELGSLAVHQDRLHATALPHLQELHRATGLVVHLAVLDDNDLVYLEKLGGRLAGAVPTRIGGRRPAHSTALGKALLSYTGVPGPEYDRVREHGIAYERGESVPGFGCIAVPVGPIGSAAAAVSVCGPLAHMRFDHRLTAPVRMAATAVWRTLDRHVTPTLQCRSHLRTTGPVRQPQFA
ncbi:MULTISPECIES: IclR family transcriptional regulator [Rhodococcus]|uniref:IclR family transcriptional regulator n=1 Tax=Rhodococcus TaxID=1827 RepID=UPI00045D2F9A|nr:MULTISPECIES: IclR family transcriptional regulator [Rhodococcus]KDE12249.1 IclR family transcriptional regulator [Rhodococcus aetherivorans]OLL18726.1 IclR family transcriptional regulator [Rhodococcus sp. M8]QPG47412.1 IclR family transcriptional regulator [Rhodococcus sp. M8]